MTDMRSGNTGFRHNTDVHFQYKAPQTTRIVDRSVPLKVALRFPH